MCSSDLGALTVEVAPDAVQALLGLPGDRHDRGGLVPSENSSGETRRQGAITKTGSRHARRLLVEAAWHYRKTPARGKTLERRQDGQPAAIVAIAWQAQQRLHRNRATVCAHGEFGTSSAMLASSALRRRTSVSTAPR